MADDSVFTKIIRGDIPAYKIYEDDKTIAFLDINPIQPGHTLVVPKTQVDHVWDLDESDYNTLMDAARKVGIHLKQVLHTKRVALRVEGFDMAHTHVHLIPCNSGEELNSQPDMNSEPDHEALKQMAERLRME